MPHIYPPIQPYDQQFIDVGQNHRLYLEQTGNPDGIPVLYLHGGPGAGLNPMYRRFFNPNTYRIIGFDQRGCGQSTPFASLEHNTTSHQLKDIGLIRNHLNISKWMLCGGSWGTTLALLYAIEQPETVTAMLLRGVFLGRQQDFSWFVDPHGGASQVFPEHFASFEEVVRARPADQSIVEAYYHIFLHGDEVTRAHAAKSWSLWEERISHMNSSIREQDISQNFHHAASLAALECHYIRHNCFIEEDFIVNNASKLKGIPGTIVHGRYDMVCKLENAYTLNQAWRNCQLLIVPEAPHSSSDPRICDALCQASAAMAKFIQEQS